MKRVKGISRITCMVCCLWIVDLLISLITFRSKWSERCCNHRKILSRLLLLVIVLPWTGWVTGGATSVFFKYATLMIVSALTCGMSHFYTVSTYHLCATVLRNVSPFTTFVAFSFFLYGFFLWMESCRKRLFSGLCLISEIHLND